MSGFVSRIWWASRPTRTAWAKRLGDFGARRGIFWLEYNPLVFMYFHEKATADAPAVIDSFERIFSRAMSYYDVGAGTAAYAALAQRRGKRVLASEYSSIGRLAARVQGVPCTTFDLRAEPPADIGSTIFDLAYCFEVAEHVPASLAGLLVTHLSTSASTVVFTAAHSGQGGTGHVNEQPKEYWVERFERAGMQYRRDLADELSRMWRAAGVQSWWLPENVMVFERAGSAD
jgi:hypothetical protein